MSYQYKVVIGIFLSFLILECYAIQIRVQSTSKQIAGLGFTVDGRRYGGAGDYYYKDNMPNGNYIFGIRTHLISGKDVGCYPSSSRKSVTLTHDTTAVLNYNNGICTINFYKN